MTEDAKPIDAEQEPGGPFSTEASPGPKARGDDCFDVNSEEGDEEDELLNRALSRALKSKADEASEELTSKAEPLFTNNDMTLDIAPATAKENANKERANGLENTPSEGTPKEIKPSEDKPKTGTAKLDKTKLQEETKLDSSDKIEPASDKRELDKKDLEKDSDPKDRDGRDEDLEGDETRITSAKDALGKDSNQRRGSRPIVPPGTRRPSSGRIPAENSRRVPTPRRSGSQRKSVPMRPENHPLHANLQNLSLRASTIEANTQKIARALVEIVKEGENRKKAYDTLYDEMRQYKEDFLYRAQKPLFLELITLFDSILRVERQYEAKESMEEAAKDIRYLKDVLLEILYRYDIEVIDEHPEKLDISIQKPIKRVDVTDPAEDRVVVQYVREGFKRDNTVLRPQEIVVKRYCKAKEE